MNYLKFGHHSNEAFIRKFCTKPFYMLLTQSNEQLQLDIRKRFVCHTTTLHPIMYTENSSFVFVNCICEDPLEDAFENLCFDNGLVDVVGRPLRLAASPLGEQNVVYVIGPARPHTWQANKYIINTKNTDCLEKAQIFLNIIFPSVASSWGSCDEDESNNNSLKYIHQNSTFQT